MIGLKFYWVSGFIDSVFKLNICAAIQARPQDCTQGLILCFNFAVIAPNA